MRATVGQICKCAYQPRVGSLDYVTTIIVILTVLQYHIRSTCKNACRGYWQSTDVLLTRSPCGCVCASIVQVAKSYNRKALIQVMCSAVLQEYEPDAKVIDQAKTLKGMNMTSPQEYESAVDFMR